VTHDQAAFMHRQRRLVGRPRAAALEPLQHRLRLARRQPGLRRRGALLCAPLAARARLRTQLLRRRRALRRFTIRGGTRRRRVRALRGEVRRFGLDQPQAARGRFDHRPVRGHHSRLDPQPTQQAAQQAGEKALAHKLTVQLHELADGAVVRQVPPAQPQRAQVDLRQFFHLAQRAAPLERRVGDQPEQVARMQRLAPMAAVLARE
jgi:hypothetical protein